MSSTEWFKNFHDSSENFHPMYKASARSLIENDNLENMANSRT